MPSRDTVPRLLRPTFAALAALALALAAVALATPAHGATSDEVTFDDLGPEASSFVVDAGEPGDELEAECFEEEEDEETEAEAAAVDEDEMDEAEEECEAEAQDTGPLPPEECVLRTTTARVATYEAQGKVRLVLRYSSLAPTDVTVEYRLKGNKGALRLGSAHKRFGQRGVFRATETLNEAQMARVRAAKSFEVELHVQGAPSLCTPYNSRHLTVRRGGHGHTTWSESDRPDA